MKRKMLLEIIAPPFIAGAALVACQPDEAPVLGGGYSPNYDAGTKTAPSPETADAGPDAQPGTDASTDADASDPDAGDAGDAGGEKAR